MEEQYKKEKEEVNGLLLQQKLVSDLFHFYNLLKSLVLKPKIEAQNVDIKNCSLSIMS